MAVVELVGVLTIILLTSLVKVQSSSLEESMSRLKESLGQLDEAVKQLHSLKKSMLEKEEFSCMLRTDVETKLVRQAKVNDAFPADDRAYKEYLSCLWKELGYLNEDGDLRWENIQKVLEDKYSETTADRLINTCNNINGITTGDTIALILLCMDDHASVLWNINH